MKSLIAAAIFLASIVGTAAAQDRIVVQVIRMGDSHNYVQFDETGAFRGCKTVPGEVAGAPRIICTKWADAEPWPTSPSSE